MSRRARACLSLILAVVLLASWASIASATNYSIDVKGQIGQSGAVVTLAPNPTPAPTPRPGSGNGGGGSTSPKTGDDTSIALYAMTSLLSLFLLILLWRKKEDQYESKTT